MTTRIARLAVIALVDVDRAVGRARQRAQRRPEGTTRTHDAASRARRDAGPLQRASAELLARRELRVPSGQQPLLPRRHDRRGDDPRAHARQRLAARDPLHQGSGSGPGALAGPPAQPRGGDGADGHLDGPVDESVRAVHRGHPQPSPVQPHRRGGDGVLCRRARGGTRARRARPGTGGRERSAQPAAGSRAPHSRPVCRISDHRRDADPDRSASDQNPVRAQDARSEPRNLERGADRRHARGSSGRL